MAKSAREHSTRATRSDPVFAALDNPRKLDRSCLELAKLEEAGHATMSSADPRSPKKPRGNSRKPSPRRPSAPLRCWITSRLDRLPGYLSSAKRIGTKLPSAPSLHRWPRSPAQDDVKAAFGAKPAGHPGGFYLRRPPLAFVIAPLFQKG